MIKIEKAHIGKLRNEEHFQFHTEFRNLVITHGAAALRIKPQFDAYLLLYEREDIALKKIVKSLITDKIKEADKARDNTYIGMVQTNTAALRHSSEAVRNAAAQLKIVFDTYGNATKMSLIEETSTIYNLLQDLELKYSAEVAAVGLEQWVAELGTRNEAYEALVRSRFAEAATKTDIVLRDARDQIDVSYTGMCDLLGAYMLVQGEAAYEAFVRALNVMVAKFNAIRHHHKNHATQEAPVIRD